MKIKIDNLKLVILLIISLVSYYFFNKNHNVLFITNIVICFFIVFKARFSLFSLKSMLINYVLISIFFQYNTGKSYGLLQLNSSYLQYEKLYIFALIYNVIMYIFVTNTKVLQLEKNMLLREVKWVEMFANIMAISAIIFSIIAFPSLNFSVRGNARFDALLPGNAWNHIAVMCLIFCMPSFKKKYIVKFSYLFCIVWFLLHSERVDMIGIIFLFITYSIANDKKIYKKIFTRKKVKYYMLILLVILLFVYIGEYRTGNKQIAFEDILRKALVQNTAADIAHVYNCSILHVQYDGLSYGKTYIHYFVKLIPFIADKEYDVVYILQKEFSTAGGTLILCEPYMNYGIIGIILFSVLEFFIIYVILNGKKNYNYFLYLFLLATQFRIMWYGIGYVEKGVIYILPIIYLIYCIFNKYKINNDVTEEKIL